MKTSMKRIGMTLLTLTMMTGMFAAANAETANVANTQTAAVEMTEAQHVSKGSKVYFDCSVPLRTAPSRSASRISTARPGDVAVYRGQNAYDERGVEWIRVRFNGRTGWVSTRNVYFD